MNKNTTIAIRECLNNCRVLSKIACIETDDSQAEGNWFWKMKIQVQEGFEHLLCRLESMCNDIGWLNGEGLWIKKEGRWLFLS